MKAEDWEKLGRALIANAELLESLATADDMGFVSTEKPSGSTTAWLIAKGLIEVEDDLYSISGSLLDIGAQISQSGFERAALDLEESVIAIKNLCEGYHEAKSIGAFDAMERNQKKLHHRTRQIIKYLRAEFASARTFLETGYGYSTRLSDQLRDIQNAIAKLKHLHDKINLFTYESLSPLVRGDRAIQHLLDTQLLRSISTHRASLDELINRLNSLSLTVRKHNRLRLLAQSVDAYFESVSAIDLTAMAEDPDMAIKLPAAPMAITGHAQTAHGDSRYSDMLEELINRLPLPKERTSVVEREAPQINAVPDQLMDVEDQEVPFALPHLESMLKALVASREPQSAIRYWLSQNLPADDLKVWLYALDSYLIVQQAMTKSTGRRLNYTARYSTEHYDHRSANRRVTDIIIDIAQRRHP
jgi:hypothetical protein